MHVLAAQGVGELADALVEVAVGDVFVLGRVVALPDDRHLVATLGEVTVQAVGGDVEGAVGEPLDVDVVVVEGGLLHLAEWLDPVDALGLLAPEAIGIDDGLLVHGFVGRLVRQGLGGHFRADRIQRSSTHGVLPRWVVVFVWRLLYPPPLCRAIRPWSYQTRTMVEGPEFAACHAPGIFADDPQGKKKVLHGISGRGDAYRIGKIV
ncbi:hypothetical protein D3C76_1086630 [compost metagenome]